VRRAFRAAYGQAGPVPKTTACPACCRQSALVPNVTVSFYLPGKLLPLYRWFAWTGFTADRADGSGGSHGKQRTGQEAFP
jgi:hypothetical protein